MSRPALRALTLCAALLLLAPLATPAAAQAPPERVTFEEALQLALTQNPRLRQTEMSVQAAGEAVELARAAFLPNLQASVQPVRRFGLGFDQTTGSLQQETSDALSASLQTQVNVFSGFRDVADLRRRQLERETGTLRLQRTREEVLFTVAAQFLTLMLDREIVGIREEALLAQQAQRERIEQLVDGGVRPRADLLQQDALLAEAELAVLQAESQLELAESELVRTLQLDPAADYDFVAPSLEDVDMGPLGLELSALIDSAFERRSDLRAQDIQIAAAEEGIRVARSGYYPQVNLFASLGSSYSSLSRRVVDGSTVEIPVTTASGDPMMIGDQPFTLTTSPRFEGIPFGDQFWEDNRTGSVGVSVTVPVFDRFLTRSQVRQAHLAAENERIVREDLEQDIAVQVRQAFLDYRNAQKRLDVTARQLAAAEAALAAEEDRYELGVSTLVELAQARARRVEAASARAQAIAQYVFQRRLLEYQAGLLDPSVDLFD